MDKVVNAEMKKGNVALAAKLKFALAGRCRRTGSPRCWDQNLSSTGRNASPEEDSLALKFDQAAELPIDSEKAKWFYMKLHLELMQGEQRIKLAEQNCWSGAVKRRTNRSWLRPVWRW